MKRNYSPRLVTISMALALCAISGTSFSQSCDPAFKQRVEAQSAQKMADALKKTEKVYGGHMKQPDWIGKSDGLLTACYNANWAKFSTGISVLDSTVKDKAVKAACDKAREYVSKNASSYQSILKTVSGYENIQDSGASALGGWANDSSGGYINQMPVSGGESNWGSIPGATIPGVNSSSSTQKQPAQQSKTGIPGINP